MLKYFRLSAVACLDRSSTLPGVPGRWATSSMLGAVLALWVLVGVGSVHAQSRPSIPPGALQGLSGEQLEQLMKSSGRGGVVQRSPSGMSSPEGEGSVTPDAVPELEDSAARRVEPGSGVLIQRRALDQARMAEDPSPVPLSSRTPEQLESLIGFGAEYHVADNRGSITVEGVGEVSVLGYNAEEIEARLSVLLASEVESIRVWVLPIDRDREAGLKPFGHDVFGQSAARETDVGLAPVNHVMGPGDSLILQYFGKLNQTVELTVLRDGTINVPELGPINIAGSTFEAARNDIAERVRTQLIGVNASVSLGALRSISVYVVGDVNRPGLVTVPATTSASGAIRAAGGISHAGSYRNVSVRRNDADVARLDLYQLLRSGRTEGDVILRQDDVVFVPSLKARLAVAGEVRRPALYELKREQTLSEVIDLAGGLTERASEQATLHRLNSRGDFDVLTRRVSEARGFAIQGGDFVRIERSFDRPYRAVTLDGRFERPGLVSWSESMRLLDAVPAVSLLRAKSDVHYLMIVRETNAAGRPEILSASLSRAMRSPQDNVANPPLMPRDRIVAVSADPQKRRQEIDAVYRNVLGDSVRMSARLQPTVQINGEVFHPGQYLLEPGLTVERLVEMAGGFTEAAMASESEMIRYRIDEQGQRQASLVRMDLDNLPSDMARVLQADDVVQVKPVPDWTNRLTVAIEGEVRFPGTYTLVRGERLADLIARAGGLTEQGFLRGAVFQRESLRLREEAELKRLRDRLRADLRAMAAQAQVSAGEQQALITAEQVLADADSIDAIGRLVVNFNEDAVDSYDNVLLQDGDRLSVPPITETVTVVGEVNLTTSHLWRNGMSALDVVELSGGVTRRADKRHIYVVSANGEVQRVKTGLFSGATPVQPGDTVVVPMNVNQLRPLELASSITQIMSQIALTIAALNSVGVF